MKTYTKHFANLDKLELVKLGYGGLVLGLITFSLLSLSTSTMPVASKWSKVARK
jgi:hypothetical protein